MSIIYYFLTKINDIYSFKLIESLIQYKFKDEM